MPREVLSSARLKRANRSDDRESFFTSVLIEVEPLISRVGQRMDIEIAKLQRNCEIDRDVKIDRTYRDLTTDYIFTFLYIVSKCLWFV